MPYQNPFGSRLGTDMPPVQRSNPQTQEDIERRRQMLESLGINDGWLGQANDFHGDLLGKRDELKSQLKDQVRSWISSSGKSAAGSGAANMAASGAASSAGMSALGASL